MRTRIAPTPSGYLHLGNLVNFVLTANFARDNDLHLALRIDDEDVSRVRPEYEADISRVLTWLEITPMETMHTNNPDRYRPFLQQLQTYVCRCARNSTDCRCSGAEFPYEAGVSAVKTHLAGAEVVVWRREDIPSYHLVNVVEDHEMRITHVIRGEDLRPSSSLHRALALTLGFTPPTYLHHSLVTDGRGTKLSKSTLRSGAPLQLDEPLRVHVDRLAQGSALS